MNNIVLASSSQRRIDILKKYNFDFKIIASDIEEKIHQEDKVKELVMSLAFRKAYMVAKENSSDIVIGADTLVCYNGEILAKPKDEKEAFRMLSLLSGNTHEVITGICLINLDKNIKIVDFEKTRVKFRKLDREMIEVYIATKEPLDKAGSYGIQGLGALFVESIEGSYLNVVGLPLIKLDEMLDKFFDIRIINMNK